MSETNNQNLRLLEAVLFASAQPLPEKALTSRLPDDADLKALLAELKSHYAGRGINLINAGKAWAFRTAPDLAAKLNAGASVSRKLSRAAVETMAIIAYHQPASRAEIEEIRGVGLGQGTLDVLLEAGWIKPRGRRKTPGRPMTWGVTDAFLDHFGLESAADLPGLADLKAAGLLDTRAAMDAYRASGQDDQAGEAREAGEGSGESQDEPIEPLDPDDG